MSKKFQPIGIGMTAPKTEAGKFIRERRLKLGLSQTALAEKAVVAQNLLSILEVGERRYLDPPRVKAIAKALNCSYEELLKKFPKKKVIVPTTEVGKLIKERRMELDLSFAQFAERLEVSVKIAKRIELDTCPTIGFNRAKRLSVALEFDIEKLTSFVQLEKKPKEDKLGKMISLSRKKLGFSLIALGKELGVSRQYVNQIEQGQSSLCNNDKLIEKLAVALKLEPEQLKALRRPKKIQKGRCHKKRVTPLADFLTRKRIELGLTQSRFAELLEVKLYLIQRIETGRTVPNQALIEKLSSKVDCQIPSHLMPKAA